MGGVSIRGVKRLEQAIEYAKKNNLNDARDILEISKNITDNQLLQGLVDLEKGIKLFTSQKHLEALVYLKNALPVVNASNDESAKFFIPLLCRFCEGLSALFNGDAHRATELLNLSSSIIEKITFFMPEFEIPSYSYKAASLMALARTYIHSSDIASAENTLIELRNVHDELLQLLDPKSEEHIAAFTEVYATRLEIVFLFIFMHDLPTLDLNMWKKRLNNSENDANMLEKYVYKFPQGEVGLLLGQYPAIYNVLKKLHTFLEIALLKRKPFTEEEVTRLINIDSELYDLKQKLMLCGKRGQGLLTLIKQLERLHLNLLQIGKAATQDFGRYNGPISLGAFILIVVIFHFINVPNGLIGVVYYLGALILSLIVGFGYGALKFRPLLKIISQAIQQEEKTEK